MKFISNKDYYLFTYYFQHILKFDFLEYDISHDSCDGNLINIKTLVLAHFGTCAFQLLSTFDCGFLSLQLL